MILYPHGRPLRRRTGFLDAFAVEPEQRSSQLASAIGFTAGPTPDGDEEGVENECPDRKPK